MTSFRTLRHAALLLALVPQLLVLGLGRGVVVCIAPGGHLQIEIAESACCAGRSSDHAGVVTVSQDRPECGSCSDVRLVLDRSECRNSGTRRFELPADATAALPVEVGTLPPAAGPTHSPPHPLDRGHGSPHLIHIRSVVLRC